MHVERKMNVRKQCWTLWKVEAARLNYDINVSLTDCTYMFREIQLGKSIEARRFQYYIDIVCQMSIYRSGRAFIGRNYY